MVSWLIQKFPETANISNSNGDQVIHFAAAEGIGFEFYTASYILITLSFLPCVGHLEILKLLVEKFGSEIAYRKDNRSTNPVFFAAQQGNLALMRVSKMW